MKLRPRHLALLVLLALGIIKIPVESYVVGSLRANKVLSPPPEVGMFENLGQMSMAASLGGLRSLVASGFYLQAFTAWEDVDWAKVDSLMGFTTRLQPGYDAYWDAAAAYMGYDAASYFRYEAKRPTPVRNQLYAQHVQRAIEILEQSQKYVPDSWRLYQRLGEMYSARMEPPDRKRAGEAFLKAYQNGALPVYERRAAYEWAKLDNDREAWLKAYDILHRSYLKDVKVPGVINGLKVLEQRLNLPPFQRIPEPMMR